MLKSTILFCEGEANWPIANNCCFGVYVDRGRNSIHGQPGYIGNRDIPINNMVTWPEHHSGVRNKIQFCFLCILRECSTVGILSAGWAWSDSGCDTVHILSRAVGEGVSEQCYHKNDAWCGWNHHVKWLQKRRAFIIVAFVVLQILGIQHACVNKIILFVCESELPT